MRATATRIALACAGVAFAAAVGQSAPTQPRGETSQTILASQPPSVLQKLESKGVVMLAGLTPEGQVRALVRFDQPRRRVIRLLSQTARQHEFRPELRDVDSHGWDESGALDTYHMKIMFMSIDYRLRTNFDFEGYRIWWQLDPEFDNAMQAVEGSWQLFEIDGRHTLGRFTTKVSVGPNLPSWLQDAVTRKKVPEAMANVKRWVDTDGKYRP